jgi:hypothetical protein
MRAAHLKRKIVTIDFRPDLLEMTLAQELCLVGAKENLLPGVNECSIVCPAPPGTN